MQFQESQRQDADIKIKPTGYDKAKEDRETHGGGSSPGNAGGGTSDNSSKIDTKTLTSGGLAVTIETDRGPGPITLTEGETVTLYVSVNQEAYLQLIYVLEDKRRVLLMDNNYHIDSSKVGTATEKEKK